MAATVAVFRPRQRSQGKLYEMPGYMFLGVLGCFLTEWAMFHDRQAWMAAILDQERNFLASELTSVCLS
jgi:hypothetical protein